MHADLPALAERLRLLGHPARLAIALRLHDGETAVGTLECELGLKQPGLSQQLAELRDGGLIEARRLARQVFYRLSDPVVASLLATMRRTPTPPDASDTVRRAQGDAARFGRIEAPER